MEQVNQNALCSHCVKQVPLQFIPIHEYNCLTRRNRSSKNKITEIKLQQKIEMIPCTQCSQSFPFQQFALHYQQCPGLQNQKCYFCKVIYPKWLIHQHYEVCEIKKQREIQSANNPNHLNPRINLFEGLLQRRLNSSIIENQSNQPSFGSRSLMMLEILMRALHSLQGLEKNQINQLKQIKAKEGDGNCAVCYCQLQDNESIYQLHCRHRFHVECLKPWLQINNKCPLCRKHVFNKQQQ